MCEFWKLLTKDIWNIHFFCYLIVICKHKMATKMLKYKDFGYYQFKIAVLC